MPLPVIVHRIALHLLSALCEREENGNTVDRSYRVIHANSLRHIIILFRDFLDPNFSEVS